MVVKCFETKRAHYASQLLFDATPKVKRSCLSNSVQRQFSHHVFHSSVHPPAAVQVHEASWISWCTMKMLARYQCQSKAALLSPNGMGGLFASLQHTRRVFLQSSRGCNGDRNKLNDSKMTLLQEPRAALCNSQISPHSGSGIPMSLGVFQGLQAD